jgi:DNA (cytosine-5)-methyltransferase 1
MRFISAFAGVDGFGLGFEQAGMTCELQIENNQKCLDVLNSVWPNVPKLTDIKNATKNNTPAVDLVCGGFPCQDVSVAWNGKGLAGKRSGLWFEFHRFITDTKPGWVVIENVTGLLSSNRGRDFAVIIRGLAESGYLSAWRVLNSEYFGVAQRRKRVFIVASLGNGNAARVLFEQESDKFNPGEKRNTTPAKVYAYKKRGGFGWSESKEISLTLEAQAGTHTGGNDTMPLIFENGLPRWLTPVECERLQGFPDGHTSAVAKTYRYRQLGNAVAVPVAYWLGKRILSVRPYNNGLHTNC